MNIFDALSLFIIIITLAIMPSASVALVVTRSATLGVSNGISVSLGIVLGDLVFILMAVFGLSIIVETFASLFLFIKLFAGSYLIWLGYSLLTNKKESSIIEYTENTKGNLIASFLSGFFLTLGDIKAILFYISLLPMFVNLETLSLGELSLFVSVTLLTIGAAKIFYAITAVTVVNATKKLNFENGVKKVGGSLLMGTGGYLVVKA